MGARTCCAVPEPTFTPAPTSSRVKPVKRRRLVRRTAAAPACTHDRMAAAWERCRGSSSSRQLCSPMAVQAGVPPACTLHASTTAPVSCGAGAAAVGVQRWRSRAGVCLARDWAVTAAAFRALAQPASPCVCAGQSSPLLLSLHLFNLSQAGQRTKMQVGGRPRRDALASCGRSMRSHAVEPLQGTRRRCMKHWHWMKAVLAGC